jgi:ATP-binding cassette, subfamily G (WHITE), member 2, PDR
VYFGELGHSASTMINYFEQNGARRCREGENPAAWLLDVIGNLSNSDKASDWSTKWRESCENARVEQHLEMLCSNRIEPSGPRNVEYAATFWQQLSLVTYRLFQQYWRDPTYLYSKFAVCVSAVCYLNLYSSNVN